MSSARTLGTAKCLYDLIILATFFCKRALRYYDFPHGKSYQLLFLYFETLRSLFVRALLHDVVVVVDRLYFLFQSSSTMSLPHASLWSYSRGGGIRVHPPPQNAFIHFFKFISGAHMFLYRAILKIKTPKKKCIHACNSKIVSFFVSFIFNI